MLYANEAEIALVKEATDKIDGWLSDAEGEFLYNAAKNCKSNGVIVEIGSWKGKSTIWLAKGSKAGNSVKIYAIDPHTGTSQKRHGEVETLTEFKENVKGANVEDVVVPVVKTSEEAERDWDPKPIELLWIDGAHDYEMVKLDFDLWSPYLIEGGTIAFHDTIGWLGPERVVKEEICNSPNFANVRFIDSITYAHKVRENSLVERLRSRWVLFLKGIYEFGGGLQLPQPMKKIAKRMVSLVQ
jgi:predicted O-methyltransferase YrrM